MAASQRTYPPPRWLQRRRLPSLEAAIERGVNGWETEREVDGWKTSSMAGDRNGQRVKGVSHETDPVHHFGSARPAVLVPGGATSSSAQGQAPGPPDTYVTDWDAVGTQAFTAAGLTPAEGHVIFAYVAIAVYDSVMAIEGGYRPFAIDVDAPAGASAEAAVAAAAHRTSSTTCRPRRRGSSIPRTPHRWPRSQTARRRRTAWRRASRLPLSSSPSAPTTASERR